MFVVIVKKHIGNVDFFSQIVQPPTYGEGWDEIIRIGNNKIDRFKWDL